MSRSLLNAIWRDDRIRFLAIGGANTLFGFVTYSVLYYALGDHVHYLVLAVIAHFVSVMFAFAMYRRHVFMSDAPIFGEFIRYNVTVFGNLGFGLAALALLVGYANFHPVFAQALIAVLLVIANYVVHKQFTFRQEVLVPTVVDGFKSEFPSKVRAGTAAMDSMMMRYAVSSLLALLLLYLVWGTGIHSDDYPLIQHAQKVGLMGHLVPALSEIHTLVFGPVSYYFLYTFFYIFGDQYQFGFDLLKFVCSGAAIWLVYRFAEDYLPPSRALLAAVFFVLLPTHDSTVFWFGTLIYALCPALIMYAHRLIRHERSRSGFIIGLLGAFSTYASPPYIFGLAVIFLWERSYKKAFCFMGPGLLYVAYYFTISRLPGVSKGRVSTEISPWLFAKHYAMQVGSFIDSAVGPSFWLKLWYSASSISVFSALLAVVVFVGFIKFFRCERVRFSRSLLLGLIAVLVLAFGMFALTGLYPQMVFNMGNRVMVYGSLLMAFLLAFLPFSRKEYVIVAVLFLIPVLGLSDHWKEWNERQLRVVENIRSNVELAQLGKDDVLLVSGHAFSKLGPFGHVEFFSETYVAGSVFRHALRGDPLYLVRSINSRYSVDQNRLIDRKYGESTPLGREVVIYDAERDVVTRLPVEQLSAYLGKLPPDIRHWLQLLEDGWLRQAILSLMPRLIYLFER